MTQQVLCQSWRGWTTMLWAKLPVGTGVNYSPLASGVLVPSCQGRGWEGN